MISRRIIRTKVLQILYAYYTAEDQPLSKTEKELFFGIEKTYDLYHFLLSLVIEIADYAEQRIEIRKNKHRPTQDDLNPNTKFIDNKVIHQLRENKDLNAYFNRIKLSWVNYPELIKELYDYLTESDFYIEYMNSSSATFADDRKLVDRIFNNIILVSEEVHNALEEMSIYWNDDIEFVVSMISKTLKKFTADSGHEQELFPMFKDEEDHEFAKNLLRKSILNHEELREMIKNHSQNWDLDRIAFMDILIMQLAVTEFIYFPSIPTKVSLNEYIELSKFYSTDKSRNFINGILDKVLKDLKNTGQINKVGRGLIGE